MTSQAPPDAGIDTRRAVRRSDARTHPLRGEAGRRRPGPDGRAHARRAARPRARPARGRAGRRQDARRPDPRRGRSAGSFKRLQFTPDLMPGDIVGTRVWRPSTDSFDTELGPIFANLVLADEINRAPAKVQSALLEAMAERQVTSAAAPSTLPAPVPRPRDPEPDRVRGRLPAARGAAGPLPPQGRRRLPERRRGADDPAADERRPAAAPSRCSSSTQVAELQRATDRVFVHHAVAQYAVELVIATREPHRFGLGHLDGAHRLRRQPPGHPGPRRRRPRPGPAARPRLRPARGRRRRRPGRPVAPARAVVRRGGRRGRPPRARRRGARRACGCPRSRPASTTTAVGATGHA